MIKQQKKERVMILDGDQRSALAAVRSLGMHDIHVTVGASSVPSLAGVSRYCAGQFCYPQPQKSDEFIRCIVDAIKCYRPTMLFPMTDDTLYPILKNENSIRSLTVLPTVGFETYSAASDKYGLMTIAQKLNIPIPKTWFIASLKDWIAYRKEIQFPVVCKPRASIMCYEDTLHHVGVRFAFSSEQVDRFIDSDFQFNSSFLIQERIEGEGVGVFLLCHKGKPKVVFSHRRIREKPPWGGVSVVSETKEAAPDALEYSMRLMEYFSWEGVAMVEFKRDNRTGIPLLMEINARFWGSLHLALFAGYDFPRFLLQQTLGQSYSLPVGVKKCRGRWLLGDLDNLYITLKAKKSSKTINATFLNKTVAFVAFVKEFFKSSKIEDFAFLDIRPFYFAIKKYMNAFIVNFFR